MPASKPPEAPPSVRRPPLPAGPYLVAGLGRAGRAAVEALLGRGEREIFVWERSTSPDLRGVARRLRRRGVEIWLGGEGLAALEAAGPDACLVKSPGIGFEAPLLRCARSRPAIAVLDELELGWRLRPGPVVAVTGTNGKSTTAGLIAAVLAGSGLGAQLAGNTEFGPPLSSAAGDATAGDATAGDGWLVAEVSSFQLEGCPSFLPEVAVLTNLTPEHLDRHGTMARYGAAKRRMFIRGEQVAPVAVVNHDDPFGRRLAKELSDAGAVVYRYGFQPGADVQVSHARWDVSRAVLALRTPSGEVELTTKLPGAHNARNVAAALAVGHALRLAQDDILTALSLAGAPFGRWELLTDASDPFDVIVDYAHTPDGIVQALSAARAVVAARPGARLHTVFGAVGLRDPPKARDSARAVRSLSDRTIFTTGTAPGDPRLVRLQELRLAAAGGGEMAGVGGGEMAGGGEVEVVLERRSAIRRALAGALPGDVVAILGLGALGRQIVDAAGTVVPFDDRQAAREALDETKAQR